MDQELKQRLVGASVIIALAIIFVPMFFAGDIEQTTNQNISIAIPEAGENNLEVKKFELDTPVVETKELPLADAELIITEEQPQLVSSESVNVPADPPASTDRIDDAATKQPIPENDPVEAEVVAAVDKPAAVTQPAAEKPVAQTPVEKTPIQPNKPVTATALNETFRVKLGSFSQAANAERVKSTLLQNNIKAIVEHHSGLKLYRVWSQEMYQSQAKANDYVAAVSRLNLNIGTPKVVTLNAEEVAQMASQGQMGWVVQLGSFSTRENAIKLRNQAKAAGFAGFVDKFTDSRGQELYRMRIGPLMERSDATKTQADIKRRLKLDGLVKPHELGQVIN